MENPSTKNAPNVDIYLENYTILEKIGEGGYGIVYKATQLSTGQLVAIKILKFKETPDQKTIKQQIARFDRETKLCAELNHPNIVKLLDKGYTSNKEPFAVFEYISGETLKDLITLQHGLPADVTGTLMGQVLDALVAAHAQGIIHRDLKPHNIMVTQTGKRSYIKILDFGIGAFTNDFKTNEYKDITLTHEVIGTPAYSAPEQLRGEPPTAKSDLYAWGLIVLECLTGQTAIQGNSVAEVFQKQLNPADVPLPPSIFGHSLGKVLSGVLDKNQNRRTATAALVYETFSKINFSTLVGQVQPQGETTLRTEDATEVNQLVWRSAHSEKRQITVLCAKLALSVSEHSMLDLETLDTLQKDQLHLCKDVGIRFGAHISGIIADTIVMYFGYPQGSDNDARRAGRTALELIGQLQKRDALLSAKQGVGLEIRIALNSGTVLIKHNSSPEGLVTNTAFNLLYSTPSGQILATESTRRLLEAHLEFEALIVNDFSNIDRQTNAFLLTGERQTEALSNLSPRSADQKMIGREEELVKIFQTWDGIRKKGGKAILLRGQAGIGKSKLIYETKKQLINQNFAVRECRCLPEYQNNALHPIFEMLKRDIGVHDNETLIPHLEEALQKVDIDSSRAIPVLCSWFSIPLNETYQISQESPAEQKKVLYDALEKLIFHIDIDRKFTLIIEDLHWIDPTSLDFLNTIVTKIDQHNFLFLLTTRPEFEYDWNSKHIEEIVLQTLTENATQSLIKEFIPQKSIADKALNYIVEKADGIPLFIEDLTRMLLEEQYLILENDTYVLTKNFDATAVPVTLKGLLNARLDHIGFAKETAQIAASIGREFTYDLLVKSSLQDEGMVQTNLNALIDANLIYHHRRVQNEKYIFRHALIRDAAYESMVSLLKQEVHGRIAETIENDFEDLVNENPFELAYHFAEANNYEKASEYGIRAAQESLKRSANLETESITSAALIWVSKISDATEKLVLEFRLNAMRFPALLAIHGMGAKELIQLTERNNEIDKHLSIEEFTDHRESSDNFRFVSHFTNIQNAHYTGYFDDAINLINQVISEAEILKNRQNKILVLPNIAQLSHIKGDLKSCEKYLKECLSLYNDEEDSELWKTFGIEPKANALYILGFLKGCMGDLEEAYELCEKGYQWSMKIGCTLFSDFGKVFEAWVAYMYEDKARINDIVNKFLKKKDEEWSGSYSALLYEWANQDIEHSESFLDTLIDQGRIGGGLSIWEPLLSETQVCLGNVDKAIDRMNETLSRAQKLEEQWSFPFIEKVLGLAEYSKNGKLTSKCEEHFRNGIMSAEEQGAPVMALNAGLSYAKILIKENQPDVATQTLKPLLDKLPNHHDIPLYYESIKIINNLKN
ncbi:TOMM system kinase/cyclase fusion protein [Aquimarina sp. MMG015]|uniref:TOMM system kinase/cyclase fusion protein n=1 Tax=Aquimarina sp. MMG015 TaxID=2822689 RepID=UPI001B3A6ABD|nr:TOMM system kinase/cyclase fusion protein [Aquimarina sp. MMG015]MBQ4802723.1 TOMM system kinase/cyclase fusion protein [Aquimarina sp. MMG015]